mmetsp:Transcript_30087/g.54608  ORF Transcript_30087/g.54608 Transcript_30087/m.54608 type:complete len:244 (-) Transcript_30087:339-1070(-)
MVGQERRHVIHPPVKRQHADGGRQLAAATDVAAAAGDTVEPPNVASFLLRIAIIIHFALLTAFSHAPLILVLVVLVAVLALEKQMSTLSGVTRRRRPPPPPHHSVVVGRCCFGDEDGEAHELEKEVGLGGARGSARDFSTTPEQGCFARQFNRREFDARLPHSAREKGAPQLVAVGDPGKRFVARRAPKQDLSRGQEAQRLAHHLRGQNSGEGGDSVPGSHPPPGGRGKRSRRLMVRRTRDRG